MTKSIRSGSRSLLVIIAALALFATACGGAGGGSSSAERDAALAAGEVNEPQLQLTADLATTQVLHTADGTATSLSEVVTGDRAVLLWYWAPH